VEFLEQLSKVGIHVEELADDVVPNEIHLGRQLI